MITMIMLFKEDDDDGGLFLGQKAEAHYQVVVMRVAMMVIIEVMMTMIEVMMVMIVGTMVNEMVVIVLTTIPL